jgi:H+-transporting ATPase
VIEPPFPSAPLFLAVVATQIVAVLMCAYGVLVPQPPWALIGVVWAYALVWMIVIDAVKLVYVRLEDRRDAETSRLTQPIAGS